MHSRTFQETAVDVVELATKRMKCRLLASPLVDLTGISGESTGYVE